MTSEPGIPGVINQNNLPLMKVIFLDIDGVLSTDRAFRRALKSKEKSLTGRRFTFDGEAVENLNRLIELTGAAIVVISSWRFQNTPETLQKRFEEEGIQGEVVGFTPNCYEIVKGEQRHNREKEILAWFSEQQEKVKYIILDDEEANYTDKLKHRLVKCDVRAGFGTPENLQAALKLLQ